MLSAAHARPSLVAAGSVLPRAVGSKAIAVRLKPDGDSELYLTLLSSDTCRYYLRPVSAALCLLPR